MRSPKAALDFIKTAPNCRHREVSGARATGEEQWSERRICCLRRLSRQLNQMNGEFDATVDRAAVWAGRCFSYLRIFPTAHQKRTFDLTAACFKFLVVSSSLPFCSGLRENCQASSRPSCRPAFRSIYRGSVSDFAMAISTYSDVGLLRVAVKPF